MKREEGGPREMKREKMKRGRKEDVEKNVGVKWGRNNKTVTKSEKGQE